MSIPHAANMAVASILPALENSIAALLRALAAIVGVDLAHHSAVRSEWGGLDYGAVVGG